PNSAARLPGTVAPNATASTSSSSWVPDSERIHAFRARAPPCALRASHRLDRLDQLGGRLLRIPVQHAGVVQVEQRVLDAGEARTLAALDDDDVLGLVGVQDGHAVDRARLV